MSNQQCGLYLAPSSIPSAGLGIFAGVDYPTGSRIGASPPSTVGIPVVDPVALYEAEELISEFGWNAASVGGFTEADFGAGAVISSYILANSSRSDFPGDNRVARALTTMMKDGIVMHLIRLQISHCKNSYPP